MFKKLLKRCRKRKEELKPGAILDQVISQSSSKANTCLLYKLANYKRGGDLIDAMQTGGQIAVEAMIREQFPMFMYNGGRGQIINRAEYLRWKYKDNKEVMIPIEASLSPHDPLGKWEDHKACWQMQYRGSLGESLLHVLIICDTKIHTKLARLLIRVFPMLALDIMEGEEYLGASALHLSIAYSNNELVIDLIEAGARVDQRATGSFFLPRDQQGRKPSKSTDYEGLAYLGEYPLAWAACCANESVYNLLLDNGADPDAQDTFGNMILHMVVVCDKLDMFGYALRHPKQPARNGIVNDAGLTPLTLACQLGRAEVFREMLELSAKEFWRYSNITCSGYPLNALDTLLPDGRTNWNSALFIILNGTKEEHLDMLDGGIIQRLLEEKWKTFARRQFLKRLLILVLHLLCLSISVYLRPSTQNHATIKRLHDQESANMNQAPTVDQEEDDFIEETDVNRIIRYCSEVATIIGVLSYVIFQQGDEVKNQGLVAFLKQLSHAPAKAIFLVSNLLILACIPFRIMGDTDTEEAILVFAVPGSWFLLMFFAGAIRLTGPFVTMIFSMITGDMFTFGIIYVIVLFGFSQAFYFLYKGHPQVQQTLFSNYFSTWMALFQTTLGDYNYSELNNTTYPNLSKTVFVIFMIFVPILLLNMLIAMMGNTYAHVIEQSEKEWMKQWAKIVVTLERAVSQSDAKSYLEAYSIPLGPANDDSGFEQRGVMVIKSKSKTRAKQRKGAVANWKRVGKVTLNALKNRGMTGEEMRRLMWGRTSISTPTKVPLKKHRDPNSPFASGALEAVLDGMAFTHDLVLCGDNAEVTVTKDAATPATTATVNPAIKGKLVSSPSLIKETLGQLPGTVGITTPQPAMTTTMGQTASIGGPNYKDPLRELVLISEAICISDDTQLHNDVHNLAKQATVLDHCKEVNANQKDKDKPLNLQVNENLVADPNKSNITTLFQDPKDIVDPEKEKEFLRRVEMLEDSDSDAFGEKPMLGKVSLIRRAKSAMTKSSTQRKNSEEQPLFKAIWDFLDKRENFNVGAENKAFEIEKTSSEADDDDNVSAAEEIRRQMETLHMKRGIAIRNEVKDNRNKKRLARNKVSPSEDSEDENAKETRRGKSAPAKKINSPPHPLQPWSTKDIMNINQILDN